MAPRHNADVRVEGAIKHYEPLHVEPFTLFGQVVDYLEFNPLTAPAFSFVLGIMMLIVIYSKNPSPLDRAVICLLLSGTLYSLGYLVVGVSSDFRYQFWSMLSVITAFVLCMPEHARHFRSPKSADWVCLSILGMTAIITLTSQILLGDALFPNG